MRSIWKDMLAAVGMGFVLPSLVLNFGVLLLDREEAPVAQITQTQPQREESAALLSLRQAEGTEEQMDLEEYLVGVVLAEMPADFEPEALKAQAVAARTYTRKAMETGGKHGDGSLCIRPSCCQGYISPEAYLSQGGTQESLERIRNAVSDTRSLCLTYEGELIEATYFSASGGRTEDAAAVWGAEYPYLRSVSSPGETLEAQTVSFTPAQIAAQLGQELSGDPERWFGAVTYTEGGGVASMEIGARSYSGTELRGLLGLRSTAFTVSVADGKILVTTTGYGHRVGMSQYGADAMAVNGSTFRQILAHYYPGAVVTQWP